MVVFESLTAIGQADAALVGSKAKSLAVLAAHGFRVPPAICISAEGYDTYMSETNLRERVLFELGRKRFVDMRWEEIWDAALRIRNLFVTVPLPPTLQDVLRDAVDRLFGDAPVVVRSSAPGEDSAEASFAGLHESFVNVRGPVDVLRHIRLVWASLWSDAALLYRQELGLDVRQSRMAVIVQAMADGTSSGVAFSRDPGGDDQAVIEAVYGLNAGLVDGTVAPDRWIVDRRQGDITSHIVPERDGLMVAALSGIERRPLDAARMQAAPLDDAEVAAVYELARAAEARFGLPQDVEWTQMAGDPGCGESDTLHVLQSRPITTLAPEAGEDKRSWYRSLTRSFENLQILQRRIEDVVVPGMQDQARELAAVDPAALADRDLAAEIERREGIYQHWREVYWEECIPFAHGVRLFGQYYNDCMQPRDPFEFMGLLCGTPMLSVARNGDLEALAQMIRDDAALRAALESGDSTALPEPFAGAAHDFVRDHGDVPAAEGSSLSRPFMQFLLELAATPAADAHGVPAGPEAFRSRFLASAPDGDRSKAQAMLELARASHRWRDDNNVYLDAIEAQWQAARDEGRRRNANAADQPAAGIPGTGEEAREGRPEDVRPELASTSDTPASPRQLVGQPAGPGIATGPARVVAKKEDLLGFKRGDILVCDALSPTMTFAIPLAGAVVERRGGMLIHGAIIAREYGLPCVTGVPDAAELIQTGMSLTVDGYLGIVRIETSAKV